MGIQKDEGEFDTFSPYKKKIFDRQNKTFIGRDFESWSKLIIFYSIFYAILIVLVAVCMWVFFQTLDPRIPKWKLERSLIGTNPGLGFRPMPADNLESTLIWLQDQNYTGNDKWIAQLNDFLEDYYRPGEILKGTASVKTCSYIDFPHEGQVCSVDVTQWKDCSKDNKYYYHKNRPCIFLKLNKIYGWIPNYIMHRGDFPLDMPQQLRDHIESITDESKKRTIWISCEGETAADVEYLGPVKYYPDIQGFPGYYYPYVNSEGYLSPLVAVHFLEPKAGVVINVECKAWAKNIQHSRAHRIGSVHFELLIN